MPRDALFLLNHLGCGKHISIIKMCKHVQSPEAVFTVGVCQNGGAQGIRRVSLLIHLNWPPTERHLGNHKDAFKPSCQLLTVLCAVLTSDKQNWAIALFIDHVHHSMCYHYHKAWYLDGEWNREKKSSQRIPPTDAMWSPFLKWLDVKTIVKSTLTFWLYSIWSWCFSQLMKMDCRLA